MYCLPSMITDLGLSEGSTWASKTHRTIAEHVCLANPHITSRDKLMEVVNWVNDQDESFLKKATLGNLVDAGIPTI